MLRTLKQSPNIDTQVEGALFFSFDQLSTQQPTESQPQFSHGLNEPSEVAGLGDQPPGDQSSSNWEGGTGDFLSEKGETGDSLPCFADKLAQRYGQIWGRSEQASCKSKDCVAASLAVFWAMFGDLTELASK